MGQGERRIPVADLDTIPDERAACVAILLLAVEIMKATRIGIRTIIDHMLAMALFIAMLVEFLLVERAGTSTFFLLLIIALVDVLVGFTVSVRSSQRQVEIQTEGPA